jgi:hypothetical protein
MFVMRSGVLAGVVLLCTACGGNVRSAGKPSRDAGAGHRAPNHGSGGYGGEDVPVLDGSSSMGGGAGAVAGGAPGAGGADSAAGGAPPAGGAGGMDADAGSPPCVGASTPARPIPLDLYFMVDQSASMGCAAGAGSDRWSALKSAFGAWFSANPPANVGLGIQYFGASASCDGQDYLEPDVEIDDLGINAIPVAMSLNGHSPSSSRPTAPALDGAVNHAIARKNTHPGHSVAVVLLTDGGPTACGAVADAVHAAELGRMNAVVTYVMGIAPASPGCNLDEAPLNAQDLNDIATAGGTGNAIIIDLTKDTTQQFVIVVNGIAQDARLPCRYELPAPPFGQMLDPNHVNLSFTPSGSKPELLYAVTGATCGATTGGWYYNDPSAPKQVILCPASCNAVGSSPVEFSIGCTGVRVP